MPRPDAGLRVLAIAMASAIAMGGCASTQSTVTSGLAPKDRGGSAARSPMFPESKWGVSASRRVYGERDRIPKGGGVYKVGSPYQVGGRWYNPREQHDYDRVGVASWYGSDFHGRKTANGEIFDMHALTAAHPTLPMPSYAYVSNPANGRTILVRINDRGPYVGERVIDLSKASADALGLRNSGTGRVRVRYAGPAPLDGDDSRERQYLASRPWTGGVHVAAVEEAVSAREWARFQEEPVRQAWRPSAPPMQPMRQPDRGPPASHAPPPQRNYADARPRTDSAAWSPYSYRESISAR